MKKRLLHIILGGLLALIPSLALAQSNERMLIYSKSGEVLPYRVEHIDSIKFLTDEVDLSLNPTVAAHENGKTGWMKLKVGSVGSNVQRIQVIIPESFMIAQMNDMQCLRLFTPEMAARMGVQIFNVEGGKEYDLSGLQRGYTYTALFLPYDEIGCAGNVKRVEFTVPNGKLAGNPKIEVNFSDITTTGYTATLTPNDDVKGYFFLNMETNDPTLDQMMQMMRVPDLKHYIVQFGRDIQTGKAHEGVQKSKMTDFKPGTSYTVYVVLVDKDGQYSDVQKVTVTTLSVNQAVTLPLAYLAEYNVNPEGTDFVTTQDLDVSGYFSYEDAVEKFTSITIAGKKYHLPSKEEWMAILPASAEPDHVSFSEQRTHSDIREDVSIAGESVSSTNDYQSNGSGSVYALRYKGTNFVSAWRYEYTTLNGGRVMKITCRSLQNKNTLPPLEEIATSEFWDTNNHEDLVRYFPAAGFIDSEDESFGKSSAGYYWSSTKHNMWFSWNALFGNEYACTYQGESSNRFSIRLFEDASK